MERIILRETISLGNFESFSAEESAEGQCKPGESLEDCRWRLTQIAEARLIESLYVGVCHAAERGQSSPSCQWVTKKFKENEKDAELKKLMETL
jgi:hypothetical protein